METLRANANAVRTEPHHVVAPLLLLPKRSDILEREEDFIDDRSSRLFLFLVVEKFHDLCGIDDARDDDDVTSEKRGTFRNTCLLDSEEDDDDDDGGKKKTILGILIGLWEKRKGRQRRRFALEPSIRARAGT